MLQQLKEEAIKNLKEEIDNQEGIVLGDDILLYINKAFDSLITKVYELGKNDNNKHKYNRLLMSGLHTSTYI